MSSPPSLHRAQAARGRLREGTEVRRVVGTGRRQTERRMVLYVSPGDRGTRVAFVCGKRVGGAVERNRARRILREAWRALAPRARGGFDIVFVARPAIRGAKTHDLLPEAAGALRAAGVIVG